MTATRSDTTLPAGYRPTSIPEQRTVVEQRADGTLLLHSALPPPEPAGEGLPGFLRRWAGHRGSTAAFRERDAAGAWRTIGWADLLQQAESVAAALLELPLGPQRPLMMLSGNSIEQAVLLLAAEYAGVPVAPVSPAYSTAAPTFTRLKGVARLAPPGAIFVQSGAHYAGAIAALDSPGIPVIAAQDLEKGQIAWDSLATAQVDSARQARLAAARSSIGAEGTARILFTSGSTGEPKGVPLSHGNLWAVAAYFADTFSNFADPQPVFLDWLPWHHVMGGVYNFFRSIVLGSTHYIDDGRPRPGLFARTLDNLREVSPTIYNTVPTAWSMLAGEIEHDSDLARSLARARIFGYGGASLPDDTLQRIQHVAEATMGERIVFCTGLGSTETSAMGTYWNCPADRPGNIGVPVPGAEVKLVPLEGSDGRYEIRIRGPFVFSGYLGRPDLTAAAFDEEGYFRLGDAVQLADPADPAAGLRFAGRTVEDFKLANGTWVRTGTVRLDLLGQCAPLIADAIVCGHDREFVAALAWPDLVSCRGLAPELAGLDAEALVQHPLVVSVIRSRLLMASAGSASIAVRRVLLMSEPPSMEANEIADKGYINQAACRARRSGLVEVLYQTEPALNVACAQ
jgi:feruloyl-CoA synthase